MRATIVQEKPRQFRQLTRERFDALIIGGGITGAGLARDLTLRGLRVALVEQGDFASGTSSASTKLIHGGLRYLEQMAFDLVFEACRERHILRRIAPHLVRPQPLMIPLYREAGRSPGLVRTGLLLYDLMALFRNIHWHRMLSAREALRRQPELKPQGLRGAALYWDCRMDDARLCLENVLAAREAGAVTVNYAKVVKLTKINGRIAGAVVQDQEQDRTISVQARIVINASGPWLDKVCALEDGTSTKLSPTRGSHLLVPRISSATEALYLSTGRDQRMFFVIPWGTLSLVGTTDINAPDPDRDARATPEEIAYLLDECNNYLPHLGLKRGDVATSFAGLRPLLAFDSNQPSKASREHAIFESAGGLLSIGGGKYTTYRAMAAELANRVMARLNRHRPCMTDRLPLPGGATGDFPDYCRQARPEMAARYRLDPATIQTLLDRYGSRTPHLLQLLEQDPALASPVEDGLPLLQLEVVYAGRFEMARTADDVLRRRTQLALTHGPAEAARTATAALLQSYR